jgi:hypothetical protein
MEFRLSDYRYVVIVVANAEREIVYWLLNKRLGKCFVLLALSLKSSWDPERA